MHMDGDQHAAGSYSTAENLRARAAAIRWFASDIDGVLTDGGMYYLSGDATMKRFHVRDGLGVELLRLCGIEVAFITSDDSPIVHHRARRLGVTRVFAGVRNKVSVAEDLCAQEGLALSGLAYIGDDLQDFDLLQQVGIAVAVGDAHPLIRSLADYVCQNRGGEGAFREAAEWLIALQGLDLVEVWKKRYGYER